jgi:glycerophosphoryl diester phosphodiesterase
MRLQIVLGLAPALIACSEPVTPAPTAPLADLTKYFDCIDANEKTAVAAHRGGPAPGYPENSLAAFERSVQNGVNVLEIDVSTTADGVLFLHHDDGLGRTTTGRGLVRDTVWADIRELSLRDPDRGVTANAPVRLEEALRWAEGRAILELDIKPGTDYDDVKRIVEGEGAEERIVLIAYNDGQAKALNARFPRSMISVSVDATTTVEQLEASGISSDRMLAWTGTDNPNTDLYADLDGRMIEVIFGTLGWPDSIDRTIEQTGDELRYVRLSQAGVDMLATDRPLAARAALARAGRALEPGECIVP